MNFENSKILNFIKKYWIIILIILIVSLSIDYNYFGHNSYDEDNNIKEEKINYPSRQFAEGIVYSNQEYFVFKHLINKPESDSVAIEFPGEIWCTYVRSKTTDGNWLYTKIK